MKKIVLFGSGTIGYRALNLLGEENILGFCDNDKSKAGKKSWGKQVFSFEQLKEKYKDSLIFVCIKLNKALPIADQLEKNGIRNFCFYEFSQDKIKSLIEEKKYEELMSESFFKDEKSAAYREIITEREQQIDYFKDHVDIKTMLPAKGMLRKRQLELVELADSFFKEISFLDIKPFLYAGNLIGYFRHNGFIPWDDDLDFGVLRKDYDKLVKYCVENKNTDGKLIFGDLVFDCIERPDLLQLVYWKEDGNKRNIDFFVYDFWDESYDFKEYRKKALEIKNNMISMDDVKERVVYVKKEISASPYIREDSECIAPGFDNMIASWLYTPGKYIKRETLLPLKKALFEGKEFYIPNDPKGFAESMYENTEAFPNDVGMTKHSEMDESVQ